MELAELHLHAKLSDDVSVIAPKEAMEYAITHSHKAFAFATPIITGSAIYTPLRHRIIKSRKALLKGYSDYNTCRSILQPISPTENCIYIKVTVQQGDIKWILNHNALFSVHTTLYNQYVNIEVS